MSFFSNTNIEKTGFISLLATLFLISFPREWSLYALALMLIFSSILWIVAFRNIFNIFIHKIYLIIPPVAYFLIYYLNVIFQGCNLKLLEKSLMFLLVPFIGFSVISKISFNDRRLITLFKVFISGIILVLVYLTVLTSIELINNIGKNVTFSEYIKSNNERTFSLGFSIFEHPTYLSMKITWAMLLVIYFFYEKKYILLLIASFSIFSISIFLLASKSGIIMWLMLILFFIVLYLGRKIDSSLFKYFAIVFISIPLITLSIGIAKDIVRINVFINEIKSGVTKEEVDWKNLDQRTREWYCAFQLIKEKPLFGHGIGRVEDRMVEEYLKNGWEEEARLRLNAHNQYLETQMTFGIPGTLSLIWMLLNPLIFRKRLKYPRLATAFVIMMSYFLLFESMFVRQWGIMFFILFYCIFMFSEKDEKDNQTGLKFY